MVPKMDHSSKDKCGKWRLPNILHPNDNDQRPNPEATSADANPDNSTQNTLASDSAYGSNSSQNSNTGIPTISNSQANAQGADIKTRTDEATGKTVTTTTTTTTTTVTTTTGDHYQVPAGQEVVVKEGKSNSDNPVELSARPVSQGSGSALNDAQQQQQSTEQGPPIPSKNNRRLSQSPHPVSAIDTQPPAGDFLRPQDQPSPTSHNFSYPSRTPPATHQPQPEYPNPNAGQRLRPANNSASQQQPHQAYQPCLQHEQPYPHYDQPGYGYGSNSPGLGSQKDYSRPIQQGPERPSTMQSMKTAAAGIHGASQTLRGTINSSIARRTGARPEIIAAHDEVANRGRQEIEAGRFYKHVPKQNPSTSADPFHSSAPGQTTANTAGQRPSSFEYSHMQPTTSPEQKYSANHSANGVLSQVPGTQPGGQYYGDSGAVGQDMGTPAEPGGKKKGGLRNVLRKSRDGLRT